MTAYNGSTKVATISTAMAGNVWSTIPDTTTGYVILPYHATASGGGGLTTEEHDKLLSLENST